MRTLLIDGNGIMYWASKCDIVDLLTGARKPLTMLPSLERVEMPSVSTEEWARREYLDFLCNIASNAQKHTVKKVRTGKRLTSAYRYLQPLVGLRDRVVAHIEGRLYLVPMADALGYTLGLERSEEVKRSAVGELDNLGVTNYLIVV